MPRLRGRTPKERGWGQGHRQQLIDGVDWFGDGWGDALETATLEERDSWPPPEVLAEMRDAWEQMALDIMAEHFDKLTRPWAWWVFDHGLDPNEARLLQREEQYWRLDELGLLSDKALADAAEDGQLTHGIRNEAHEPAFRRNWHWWRFLAPERRDKTLAEAVQLVALYKEGHDVLSDRERYVVQNKADVPEYRRGCAVKVRLSRVECDVLDLPPDEFHDQLEDEGDE